MAKEIITEAEKKLSSFLHKIIPDDADFRVYVGLLCRQEGVVEELVGYIESNNVKTKEEICLWLFGSENEADFYKDMEEEEEEVSDA